MFVSLKCGVTLMLHVNTLSWNARPFDDGTGTLSRNVTNKTYHQRHAALQKSQDLNFIAGRGGRLKFPKNGPLTCTVICHIFVRVLFHSFPNQYMRTQYTHNSTISVPATCFDDYVAYIRDYNTPSCLTL